MSFESVIGHKHALNRLRGLAPGGRRAHAYLFAGPSGVGKRKVATEYAESLGADLIVLERVEDKRDIVVDQVREVQRRLSFRSPGIRAILIDEAERLNEEGQNAFLKTLEEPPEGVIFLLVSASPALLLPTIVSRCHTVLFFPLPDGEMHKFLKTLGLDSAASDWIGLLAEGSPGRAKDLAGEIQDLKVRARDLFDNIAAAWLNPVIEKLGKIRDTEQARHQAREILTLATAALREALRSQELGKTPNPLILPDGLRKRLEKLDSEDLADRIRDLMDHQRYINQNANIALTVEDALLRI